MSSPCAACKFLRRKCTQDCVFSPYFPPDQPQKFASVHLVFGRSNVAKLLSDLDPSQREYAVDSLVYEAEAILRNPVYGCVAYIHLLQQRLKQIQHDLYFAKQQLSAYIGPAAVDPLLPPHYSPFGASAEPFHHHQQDEAMNVGLGLTSSETHKQMLLREQQQIELQQLEAVARDIEAQQQQQQQQNEINARFGNNSGFVDGRVSNNNSVSVVQVAAAAATGGDSPLLGLALVSPQQFGSSSFHIQQQLQAQQQQIQIHHQMQQQRAGSDKGVSGTIGSTS